MAKVTKDCGCSPYTPCSPVTCTSYVAPECDAFNLSASNTLSSTGISDVSDITVDVKKISAFKDHLEFVNSPKSLSNIVGHTVLRLSTKFLNGVTNLFRGRNVGTGAKLYKGLKVEGADTFQDFRTLKGSESIFLNEGTDEVTVSVDPDWLETQVPTVDYPVIDGNSVGVGVPFYKGLIGKKINISSLYSESMLVSEYQGGTRIELLGGGSVSNDWYLDVNFQRPSNWGTSQNQKEEITYLSSMTMINPALYTNGQVVKVPEGTLNDPFKTYEEYLLKRIYGVGGSGTGISSKHNPKYPRKTLQILNSFSTSSDLEVINTTFYIKNFSTVTYTGVRQYAFDYRTIFDALTISGNLQIAVDNVIKGEGTITSANNFGLIYSKTDSTKTSNGTFCTLFLQPEGKGLYFIEGNNTVVYSPLTNNLIEGGPLKYGNNTVLGANQPPVTPLIVIEGTNYNSWNTFLTGTSLFLRPNTQIGIRYFNDGKITSSLEKLLYQVGNDRIGYETRLDNTSTGVNQQIVDFYETTTNGKVYYKPYSTYCMFRGEDTSEFRIENLSTFPNGFMHSGMDSIISLSGSARFDQISEIKDVRGAPALNFIKAVGNRTIQNFNTASIDSKYFNFVKGDGTNTIELVFKHSQIDSRNISQDVALLNITTLGTLSTIKRNPIITVNEYLDEAEAKSLGGLTTGMMFKKQSSHEIINVTNP